MFNFNKKTIGVLLIVLAVILIAVLLLFFLNPKDFSFKKLFKGDNQTEIQKTAEEEFNEMQKEIKESKVYTFDQDVENNREWNENDFKSIARSFSERFGSYSNQSDYGNITDVYDWLSSDMKEWADSYINNLKANTNYSGTYYGITTKALIEPLINNFNPNSNRVEVIVKTQREEVSSSNESKIFDQDIKIIFIKENGNWLVDEATWL
ncbi:MAG: hypothetical protein PHU32_05680 [Candidatus ainarchaeum sp.]|nr:hypothetical protein [Candidatus ainarchaeum sp.]